MVYFRPGVKSEAYRRNNGLKQRRLFLPQQQSQTFECIRMPSWLEVQATGFEPAGDFNATGIAFVLATLPRLPRRTRMALVYDIAED
jgi:hypothetical protein